MQGLILAAGMGKRLQSLTFDKTKCMVEVNGETLIERTLRILDKKNLSRIIIVIGYQGHKLRNFINELHIKTPLVYIENQIYDKTNNIYSLMLANELLCEDDTLLLESDLIFDECVVDILIEDSRGTLALVDKYENWMDGACTILDDNDCIVDFVPGKYLNFEEKERYFKTVNIYKFSTHFSQNTYVPFLKAYAAAMGNNEYYESVIKLIAMLETKEIRAKRLQGQHWYEIDDIQDLDIAESIFARNSNEKYEIMSKRYGGYWRYPHLIDFCYLVNPYFPPRKMIHEIISSFPELLTQYPSGMRVNSLLVAKKFALKQCHIAVGNGAAEIIKSMMEQADFKKVGFIRPTFEEYPNRFCKEAVYYNIKSENFQYSVEDVMMFFDDKDLDALVIINPDNPSGNYLSMSALRKLLLWAQNKEIVLIVDESFVDFVETDNLEGEHTVSLLEEDILEMYPQLFVIKSISKSYGVPGIRLGIIASSDEEMIDRIKADLSIWNINSFAEFFLQISDKYENQYQRSLAKVKKERAFLERELNNLETVEVFPSQANYIMCEIKNELLSSRLLAEKLLEKDIFIKDLTPKIKNGKQYIRLAVRNRDDNIKLVDAMKELL